jgi:hypothetical protein
MNTLFFLLSVAPAAEPASPLTCAEPQALKGEVKAGPVLTHTFELTNRSGGTLTVTQVQASCGCLRRTINPEVLRPNETARLTLEVNTLTQPEGPNKWQVSVAYTIASPTSAPQPGELLLQLSATLTKEITVSPPQIAFSTSRSAEQVITVADSRERPFNIVKVISTTPDLTAELGQKSPLNPRGQSQAVTIRLSEAAPAGRREEAVILVTDDPQYRELRVPVEVLKRASSGVSAAPESVSLQFTSDQTELSTLVQLRSSNGKPFNITAVEGDHPGVTAKFSITPGPVAVVRVTVTEAASAQPGTCKLKVKLAGAAEQEVTIPVSWTSGKK